MVSDERFAPYDWSSSRIKHLPHDLTGETFNNLTVLYRSADVGRDPNKPVVNWVCRCKCGNLAIVSSSALITGHSKSCGCMRVIHNESHKTRLYCIWENMKKRCRWEKDKRYKNYGGRGISVCDEWKNNYLVFKAWALSSGYKDDLTIERIDNNGNYCPENCRWATLAEQAQNTTRTRYVDFHGKKMTIRQIATELGVTYSAVQHRLDRGQPLDGKYKTVSKRIH